MCPRPLDDGDAGLKNRSAADIKAGGARRDRTADLLHAMQALSQLSYGPTWRRGTLPDTNGFVKEMNGLHATRRELFRGGSGPPVAPKCSRLRQGAAKRSRRRPPGAAVARVYPGSRLFPTRSGTENRESPPPTTPP